MLFFLVYFMVELMFFVVDWLVLVFYFMDCLLEEVCFYGFEFWYLVF